MCNNQLNQNSDHIADMSNGPEPIESEQNILRFRGRVIEHCGEKFLDINSQKYVSSDKCYKYYSEGAINFSVKLLLTCLLTLLTYFTRIQ